jgi:transcriptional regulator with XRE-family HTH domain
MQNIITMQERLRSARKAKGWILADIEKASGGRWKGQTIGTYERGTRMVAVDDLFDIAALYDVRVDWLLGLDCQTCATTLRINELENELKRLRGWAS